VQFFYSAHPKKGVLGRRQVAQRFDDRRMYQLSIPNIQPICQMAIPFQSRHTITGQCHHKGQSRIIQRR